MARRLVATGESERRLLWRGHARDDLSRRLEARDLVSIIRRLVGTGISDMRLLWRRHARDDLLMRMLCVLENGIWLTPNASLETALRRRGDGGVRMTALGSFSGSRSRVHQDSTNEFRFFVSLSTVVVSLSTVSFRQTGYSFDSHGVDSSFCGSLLVVPLVSVDFIAP